MEVFDVTAPANTPKAAPLEVLTPWQQGELVGVQIVIPDGHSGLTGIFLAVAHSRVIPYTADAWIVGNDEVIDWDTAHYLNTGAWSAFVYNVDLIDHAFHLRYLVADLNLSVAAPAPAAIAPPPLV